MILRSLSQKNCRIRQPRAHHFAVTGRNRRAAVAGLDIRHQDKPVRELFRAGMFQNETFWLARIVARMTSGGISKKFRLELAHEHDGPFHEARDFVQQAFVLDEFEPLSERQGPGIVENDVAPPRRVEHHLRLFQRRDVIVEPAYRDPARREKPVSVRGIARR